MPGKRYTYTLAALNKRAAKHELELVKSAGYFYWIHKRDAYIESIPVYAFSHAPEEFWDRELEAAIVQVEEWKKERALEFTWIKTRDEQLTELKGGE
jgi:hypothetical protein